MVKLDKKELKGFTYAGIAAIALANSFIFSKLCFKELDFFQFGFWWFLFGTVWNFIYIIYNKKGETQFFRTCYKSLTKPLILIVTLEALATGLFYYAILTMENPGVVSFIGNIGPVFVTLLGLFFLKETFSKTQFLRIILAISGIFILNYKGYKSYNDILISGSHYVILASLLFSIAAIIARKKHHQIDAGILSVIRALVLLISFSILLLSMSRMTIPGFYITLYLIAGSFLEVFITIVFAYLSFKYIKAFKTSITISTKGIFALLSSWIFLSLQPTIYQIVGGILSLVGVFLVSKEKVKG
jgi:drug/metabolite transporter (DMT)-like permease